MAHVRFSIDIQETDYTSQGKDSLEFMFSANLGESQRRLKEIASGGETFPCDARDQTCSQLIGYDRYADLR